MIHHRLRGTGEYDPYFSSVSLLLHFDGADGSTTITDSSSSPKTITVNGDAQIDTAQSQFGGSSLVLDGNEDWIAATSVPAFGTSDFTVEFFVRFASITTCGLWDCRPDGENYGSYPVIYLSGAYLKYWVAGDRIDGTTLSQNTWYHIALSRSGTSTKLFINGTQTGSTYTDSTDYLTRSAQLIGKLQNGYYANCHFEEFRITNGVARYTGNFTAPTKPFPTR